MDQIITPDCPQCHGEGSVPFDRDRADLFSRRPCGQCCRRWDLANPYPSPKFMSTKLTMAEFTAELRRSSTSVRGVLANPATDEYLRKRVIGELEWMLGAAADFVASHDPSTKMRLSEAESPYCVACDYDHPGPCPE
jgi:hypothetical protein